MIATRAAALALALSAPACGEQTAEAETPAPTLALAAAYADRPACAERFVPFATGRAAPFLTDGLAVVKDGETVLEFYDGVFDAAKPHHLWSASKTVTATLLGAAIQQGMTTPDGQRLSLATPLASLLGERRKTRPDDARFAAITLEHLIEMTAGFEWAESYEGDVVESTVLRMLYLDGHADMAGFAINRPLAHPPGTRWIYSGGNANMVMAALRVAAGEDAYRDLPWRLLFEPLGIGRDSGVAFERDRSGTFVGSSYVHLAPRDMARIGELFLADGVWRGQRILPEGWVAEAGELVAAQARPELGPDYVAFVNREGLYGRRGFWLNAEVGGFALQFPNAPRDMFFAAGHYGQLIVVLPSQRMVIARTGHDQEYWSKIDEFVSGAVACFAD